jgi:hypothetical protein
MKGSPTHWSLALAALALAGLACTCPVSSLVRQLRPTPSPTASPPVPASPQPDLDPPDPLPTSAPAIPAEVAAQMDEIEAQVVRLRGLRPSGPVQRALLSPEELRQHVLDDFLSDYTSEEAEDDARVLALLGLLPSGYDMYTLYLDLYSEQIAGFYDDEQGQMYVVQAARFGGAERVTHAHEYTHALQDQHYSLSDELGYNDEDCEADSEACAAVRALIEGDATLLEQQWLFTYATQQDWDDITQFYDSYQSPVFDSAPLFLQQDFLFPYEFGYTFVNAHFLRGGWAAVDALYDDPPRSTEHILHPERYPGDRPVWLQVPDLVPQLGDGWREVDRNVLGEWYTRLMLQEQLEAEQAEPAAEGWGGDYYLAFHHDVADLTALVLLTQWDSIREAYEFMGAFRLYADARFGTRASSETIRASWHERGGYTTIEIRGNQTLWILAPDSETAGRLREAVDFPAQQVPES